MPKIALTKDLQDQREKGFQCQVRAARILLKKWAELEVEGAIYEEIVCSEYSRDEFRIVFAQRKGLRSPYPVRNILRMSAAVYRR